MSGLEHYDKGRAAMDAGDFHQAIACFQQSAQIDPHFKTYELLGECLIKIDLPQQAIAPLQSAAAMNTSVRAVSLLSEAFFMLGKLSEAEQVANEALRRDTNNRKAREIIEKISHSRG